jgi:cell division septation protein DedD
MNRSTHVSPAMHDRAFILQLPAMAGAAMANFINVMTHGHGHRSHAGHLRYGSFRLVSAGHRPHESE